MNHRQPTALKFVLPACLALAFTSCTTESQQKVNAFLNSPIGVKFKDIVIQAGEAAAREAVKEVASGNKADANLIAAAAIDGGVAGLRTTQDTPGVTDPKAIKAAVTTGADSAAVSNRVAPAVATAITNATATDKNVAPNTVSEAAAQVLEALAAKKRAEAAAAKPKP